MQRKVLITGAAGFIGSRLAHHLQTSGFNVATCDIFDFEIQSCNAGDPHHLDLLNLRHDRVIHFLHRQQIEYHSCDIANFEALINLFKQTKPDVVVHLAAQAGVRHSVKAPMDFVRSNLLGFAHVLDACREFNIEEFLYASSSSVYGARTEVPFCETDRVDKPESLYAATKMANELMAYSYFSQYKTPSLGLRFFTVYGPWGRLDMAPLLFAQQMLAKQPIQLYGSGLLQRDFTYVGDTVHAVGRLIELGICKKNVDIVNIGHSNPIEVTKFVNTLADCLGVEPIIELAPMQISDVPLTYASDQKLTALIGEWPHTPLKAGLTEMTQWLSTWHQP